MDNIISAAELVKRLLINIPSIIAATTVFTGFINGVFNIHNGNAKHTISWIISVICTVLAYLFNSMSFGLGWMDYLVVLLVGLLAGGASNGLYDWPTISNIIDKFYNLFGNKK